MARVPINPKLPPDFDNTPNEQRPASHQRWWNRPFIVTYTTEDWDRHYAKCPETAQKHWAEEGRRKWLEAWPGGTRYDVRCLDGGAWDRSTCWGSFGTLEEALACAGAETVAG